MNGPNLFQLPPPSPEEQVETLREGDRFRLERIISRGQITPPGQWYDQEWDEWVTLLQGSARLRLEAEDGERRLEPGDTVWLPAHCRHRVEWTQADPPTIWIALHLQPADLDRAVAASRADE